LIIVDECHRGSASNDSVCSIRCEKTIFNTLSEAVSIKGDLDRYGRDIPDAEYQTVDFERAVALKARTEAIARNLTDFL